MADQGAHFGGNWLREPEGRQAVVFVHGILSTSEGAWINSKGVSWPSMLLADEDLKDIGIGVFTYRADWKSRTYSIGDAADSLREFANAAGLWALQPIIFVCHSMGGIVVRRFLVANQVKLIDSKCKLALFFIASPSVGSRDANRVLWLSQKMRNVQAQALRSAEDNVWLNDLDKDFMNLKASGRVPIVGKELIEDEPVAIKKLFGMWTQVVPSFSAARYFPDSLKIAGTDHSTICKPESSKSEQYVALKLLIRSAAFQLLANGNQEQKPEADEPLKLSALAAGRGIRLNHGHASEVRFQVAGPGESEVLASVFRRLKEQGIEVADWSLQRDGECRLVGTSDGSDLDVKLREILGAAKGIQLSG
jgi:pimeloyl-ACP methyl ester carboxylesterase